MHIEQNSVEKKKKKVFVAKTVYQGHNQKAAVLS